ncbi:MAG: T9SS type A sorting domain-containing protein [Bacteroidetes bacterium]|nr:T9SS type A sorting domain-containing protein [Bacteroidota bacterium]
MKNLLTLLLITAVSSIFAQTWQSIGTFSGTGVIHQDLAIDPSNGDLYIAYVENATQRANVRKWDGSAWTLIGNASFGSGASMTDIKIAAFNGQIYVAPKFLVGPNYYIRPYYLNGSTWSTMGSTNYQTPQTYDYSLKVSPVGNPHLCFFNQTPSAGSTDLITLMLTSTSQGQIGGLVTDSYVDNHDFVLDGNEDPWVATEYGDMSNYVNVCSVNSPYYDVQNTALNDWSGKIVTNLVGTTDMRFASHVDDTYLGYTRYNLGTGTVSSLYTIYATAVSDYDMTSTATLDYFFYSIGGTHFVESVNASGTQTAMGTAFMTGSGTITDPRIENWNGRIVVSCVRGGVVRVMEIDNTCTVTLGNTFGGCEQTLITAPTPSLIVNDNNYSHAGLSVTVNSTDVVTVPNPNAAIVGTYPNYYLQFTSTDIAVTTNVEFEFETVENGNYANYVLFYADAVAIPTINLSVPFDEVCENNGIVNLTPYGSPAGGFWSGTGVNTSNGKFNPDVANPGVYVLNYTYNDSYGCSNDDNVTMTVNPVPQVTVTTTNATCGAEDGTANATITGGTPAYTIYWSNGSALEDQADLAPGMYFINVTDSKGCQATKPANVTSNGLTLSAVATDVTCPGAATGSIDLTASSTSGIQSIEWSNGAITEDVSGLPAGSYEVTVTANDGCVSTASFEVTSPDPLTFAASTSSATCGSTDGSATCNVSGGTSPYDFQWFETVSGTPVGTNNPTISGFGAGAYFAIITDANGCSAIHNTMISEVGGPEVLIAEVTPAGCADDGAINISINTDQPITLIEWSNGETTEDITALAPGFYTVEVTDQAGCMGMGGVEVPAASPDINPICLVTVDTSTNTNLLVWEKPITTDIDYFNIYRETSVAGEFLFVASVPYSDESVYNDLVASPQVRSWRYKIGAVNFCGEESDLSEFHKTIHLTISIGLGSTINLNWDEYEGFTFPTYDLYRHTNSGGWTLLQSMPSNLFSYVDTPPTFSGLDYIISVSPPATCTSTNKVQDHNSSRSNKSSSITGDLVGIDETDATGLTSIYPNPSTGEFIIYINAENAAGFQAVVTDAQGRIVMQFNSSQEMTIIDLSDFSDGIYNLQIVANDQLVNRKLVKQ